jgi:carboxypeptidase D
MYIPYLASHMLDANDTTYYNVSGALFYDPSITYPVIQNQVTTVPFMDYWYGLMPLNDSFSADIHARYKSCGFEDYVNKYLVYPPAGQQPTPGDYSDECANLYNDAQNAALALNPCWDVYQVATTCPILWDVLGFPGSIPYIAPGQGPLYFDRADVKKAINAPQNVSWEECASGNVFVGEGDTSLPPAVTVLGSVIDRTQNVIIGHGALDMILINNGTLLAIQNMTWGGKMGFQSKPVEPFYVPYHEDDSESNWAGAGVFGTSHTERGLTYVGVDLSGHMVPQYAPSAAWTQLEKLLGRIDSLETIRTFSTEPGYPQSSGPLGYGTAPQGYSTGGGSAKMMGRTAPGRRVGAA